jgi:hypothetical protein
VWSILAVFGFGGDDVGPLPSETKWLVKEFDVKGCYVLRAILAYGDF